MMHTRRGKIDGLWCCMAGAIGFLSLCAVFVPETLPLLGSCASDSESSAAVMHAAVKERLFRPIQQWCIFRI